MQSVEKPMCVPFGVWGVGSGGWGVGAFEARNVSLLRTSTPHSPLPAPHFRLRPLRVNTLGHIALGGVGDERDHALARSEFLADLNRRGHICSRGRRAEDAFLGCQTADHD